MKVRFLKKAFIPGQAFLLPRSDNERTRPAGEYQPPRMSDDDWNKLTMDQKNKIRAQEEQERRERSLRSYSGRRVNADEVVDLPESAREWLPSSAVILDEGDD